MSEELLSYASKQDLPRGPHSVLMALAWFHTEEQGCFPSQTKIAEKTKFSRSTVNTHLSFLEKRGVIRRSQRKSKGGVQKTTFYEFPDFEHSRQPKDAMNRASSVSNFAAKPCPETDEIRVQKTDTNKNLGIKNNTTNQGNCFESLEAPDALPDKLPRRILERIKCRYLSLGKKLSGFYWEEQNAILHIEGWISEGQQTEESVLTIVFKEIDRFETVPKGPKAFDKVIQASSTSSTGKLKCSDDKYESIYHFWAYCVNNNRYVPPSAISAKIRLGMLDRKLVTEEQLRAIGV